MTRRALRWIVGASLVLFACETDPRLGNECEINSDCEGALQCVGKVCAPPCLIDADCADAGVGAQCRFNRCVVPVTPEADAAAADAMISDASPDLAMPDAAIDMSVEADATVDMAVEADAAVDMAVEADAAVDMAVEADAAVDMAVEVDAAADMAVDAAADMAAEADAMVEEDAN